MNLMNPKNQKKTPTNPRSGLVGRGEVRRGEVWPGMAGTLIIRGKTSEWGVNREIVSNSAQPASDCRSTA